MRNFLPYTARLLLFIAGMAGIFSCSKGPALHDRDEMLEFSVDTLVFDTVFTTVGSVTRHFKVFNRHPNDMVIRSIRLAGGPESPFRINVDGIAGPEIRDYTLRANDSMFVFVEVTIDPLEEDNPLVVPDSIVFITENARQDVNLLAWGQDVHLLDSVTITTRTWTSGKPYLIYNSLLVDTGQVLTIEEGVQIYLHRFSTIYVAGTLLVKGTVENPVVFQGDRLETMYRDIPGQWNGLYFLNGSGEHELENMVVRNASSGIHMGNLFTGDPAPRISLRNVIIEHMTYSGLSSIGGTVRAENLLITDCGRYSILLTLGGDYHFLHCTVANYWAYTARSTPAVLIADHYRVSDDQVLTADLVAAEFGNCIIDGRKETELGLSRWNEEGLFGYRFSSCYLKAPPDLFANDPEHFENIFTDTDPGFVSLYDPPDFTLLPEAFARDKGDWEIAQQVPFDLAGNSRLVDGAPDLGAYETIPEK
ncbi:MAG TPA: right-handed parallel beta-helix repeat-containing protein [Bacteroidetes bacterium]|nr:right-handed parallel beta-helix repeat-containing protein [Bacteroidota bacterium]